MWVPAGATELRVAYRGAFSPGLRGLYRAGGLAVTQFEAADARRLFPCFDEPAFKAVWQVTVAGVPPRAAAIRSKWRREWHFSVNVFVVESLYQCRAKPLAQRVMSEASARGQTQ